MFLCLLLTKLKPDITKIVDYLIVLIYIIGYVTGVYFIEILYIL